MTYASPAEDLPEATGRIARVRLPRDTLKSGSPRVVWSLPARKTGAFGFDRLGNEL